MISTAAAMLTASRQSPRRQPQTEKRRDREDIDDVAVPCARRGRRGWRSGCGCCSAASTRRAICRAACPRRAPSTRISSGPARLSMPARTACAGRDRLGHRLAGQHGGVEFGAAFGHGAVGRHAARRRGPRACRPRAARRRDGLARAVRASALGDVDLERGDLGGGRAGRRRGSGARGSGRSAGRRSASAPRRRTHARPIASFPRGRRRRPAGSRSRSARPCRGARRGAPPGVAKNGCAAKATAGSAIAAEIQCSRSRVLPSAPDQTATDSSMTFISAKPGDADAGEQRAALGIGRGSASSAALSSGRASKPARSSAAIRRSSAPGASSAVIGDALERQVDAGGRDARARPQARSTPVMQSAQWIAGSDSSMRRRGRRSGLRRCAVCGARGARAAQAGQPARSPGRVGHASAGRTKIAGAGRRRCRPAATARDVDAPVARARAATGAA